MHYMVKIKKIHDATIDLNKNFTLHLGNVFLQTYTKEQNGWMETVSVKFVALSNLCNNTT